MNKKFQMVCGLWVTPDVSDVTPTGATLPWVEQLSIDFVRLHRALSDMFPYGPHVKIQVPNDTIDGASVQVRQKGGRRVLNRCEDFANVLLRCAKKSNDDVVDVRRAWTSLHALPDRDLALPPVILPFVITASAFEEAMIWSASTRLSLGLPVLNMKNAIRGPDMLLEDSGSIPFEFQQKLAQIFGVPFAATAVLDRMAMDTAPKEGGIVKTSCSSRKVRW